MPQYRGFVSSSGPDGWYTTTEENEQIMFRTRLVTLNIETETNLAIQVGTNPDLWYVKAGYPGEGIDGMSIPFIQVMAPAGTKLKWKGLY